MLLKIHPENPEMRKIRIAVEHLEKGGLIIFPTDTVYAIGASLYRRNAVERLCRIKGLEPKESHLSILCSDLSMASQFTLPFNTNIFKTMKRTLPGPFTFILKANKKVPEIFKFKKKTIGVRIPDNKIAQMLINELGQPLISTSIREPDEVVEYITEPELIYEKFEFLVDVVIDGGIGGNEPSTIVDCTNEEPKIIREGKGVLYV